MRRTRVLLLVSARAAAGGITEAAGLTLAFRSGGGVEAEAVGAASVGLTRCDSRFLTFDGSVAEESGKAEAHRLSVFDAALCVHSADAALQAWVLAGSSFTLLVQIAVVIGVALDLDAFDGWFSRETVRAQAKCAMVSSTADCFVSTLALQARILALSTNAGHVVAAVRIGSASINADISLTKLTGSAFAGVAFRSAGSSLAGLTTSTIVDGLALRQTELFRIIALAVVVAALDGAGASNERISNGALTAAALNSVVEDVAFRARTALARQ